MPLVIIDPRREAGKISELCFPIGILITNLNETYEPFGTLRRGDHITILIKQTNRKIPGEFLGRLVLGVEDGEIKVFGATIY